MKIKIGKKLVGDNCPAFIIAEIGSNHNQDFSLALKHIDAAADAGVDAVKFQTFNAEKHVSKYAEMPEYLTGYDNIQQLISTLELNRDWQQPLKEYAESLGLEFFSSPCDVDAVDSLEKLNVPAHKVASFDLPDLDLIRYIGKTGKPLLLSTGLANMAEIQRAIDVCKDEGNKNVILLQCTSLYPAPTGLSNLKSMQTMRDKFNVIVGYSDHTLGSLISTAAVAMGASVIEKHFTLDRNLPGPDHSFAIEPAELKQMVDDIRAVEQAAGDGEKHGPREEELDMYHKVRRSIHASVDIKAGEVITADKIVTKRPGHGFEPYRKDEVIGSVARIDIAKDHWISEDMI